MDYQYILVDVKDRIATVTINRPEYSNAFARESYFEIADAMNTLGAREDVGAIGGADGGSRIAEHVVHMLPFQAFHQCLGSADHAALLLNCLIWSRRLREKSKKTSSPIGRSLTPWYHLNSRRQAAHSLSR